MLGEVTPGGGVLLDRASRRDVVGGHAIAEHREHPGTGDVGDRGGVGGHAVEVRRAPDVGRRIGPLEGIAAGHVEALPALVAGEHVGVGGCEPGRRDGVVDDLLDLVRGGPQVREEDVLAVGVLTQRVRQQVDVHGAGERVRHDERW